MKTKLLRFLLENTHRCEYHWHDDNVILMVDCSIVTEFNDLFPSSVFDDDGIACIMKDGYFCFWMKSICEYYDCELIDLFPTKINEP